VLGARALPGIEAERARLRGTLVYQWTSAFSLGIEWNPLAEELNPLANWRVFDEDETRPALIVGTSSDRIGTEEGNSWYATIAKDLEAWSGLPLSPYAGVAWSEAEDELHAIGGASIRLGEHWSSLHMWDGENLHHVLERSFDEHVLGLVLAQQDDEWFLGLSWSWAVAAPWARE
jgi:hypothetical protein